MDPRRRREAWMKDKAKQDMGSGALAGYYFDAEERRKKRLKQVKSVVKLVKHVGPEPPWRRAERLERRRRVTRSPVGSDFPGMVFDAPILDQSGPKRAHSLHQRAPASGSGGVMSRRADPDIFGFSPGPLPLYGSGGGDRGRSSGDGDNGRAIRGGGDDGAVLQVFHTQEHQCNGVGSDNIHTSRAPSAGSASDGGKSHFEVDDAAAGDLSSPDERFLASGGPSALDLFDGAGAGGGGGDSGSNHGALSSQRRSQRGAGGITSHAASPAKRRRNRQTTAAAATAHTTTLMEALAAAPPSPPSGLAYGAVLQRHNHHGTSGGLPRQLLQPRRTSLRGASAPGAETAAENPNRGASNAVAVGSRSAGDAPERLLPRRIKAAGASLDAIPGGGAPGALRRGAGGAVVPAPRRREILFGARISRARNRLGSFGGGDGSLSPPGGALLAPEAWAPSQQQLQLQQQQQQQRRRRQASPKPTPAAGAGPPERSLPPATAESPEVPDELHKAAGSRSPSGAVAVAAHPHATRRGRPPMREAAVPLVESSHGGIPGVVCNGGKDGANSIGGTKGGCDNGDGGLGVGEVEGGGDRLLRAHTTLMKHVGLQQLQKEHREAILMLQELDATAAAAAAAATAYSTAAPGADAIGFGAASSFSSVAVAAPAAAKTNALSPGKESLRRLRMRSAGTGIPVPTGYSFRRRHFDASIGGRMLPGGTAVGTEAPQKQQLQPDESGRDVLGETRPPPSGNSSGEPDGGGSTCCPGDDRAAAPLPPICASAAEKNGGSGGGSEGDPSEGRDGGGDADSDALAVEQRLAALAAVAVATAEDSRDSSESARAASRCGAEREHEESKGDRREPAASAGGGSKTEGWEAESGDNSKGEPSQDREPVAAATNIAAEVGPPAASGVTDLLHVPAAASSTGDSHSTEAGNVHAASSQPAAPTAESLLRRSATEILLPDAAAASSFALHEGDALIGSTGSGEAFGEETVTSAAAAPDVVDGLPTEGKPGGVVSSQTAKHGLLVVDHGEPASSPLPGTSRVAVAAASEAVPQDELLEIALAPGRAATNAAAVVVATGQNPVQADGALPSIEEAGQEVAKLTRRASAHIELLAIVERRLSDANAAAAAAVAAVVTALAVAPADLTATAAASIASECPVTASTIVGCEDHHSEAEIKGGSCNDAGSGGADGLVAAVATPGSDAGHSKRTDSSSNGQENLGGHKDGATDSIRAYGDAAGSEAIAGEAEEAVTIAPDAALDAAAAVDDHEPGERRGIIDSGDTHALHLIITEAMEPLRPIADPAGEILGALATEAERLDAPNQSLAAGTLAAGADGSRAATKRPLGTSGTATETDKPVRRGAAAVASRASRQRSIEAIGSGAAAVRRRSSTGVNTVPVKAESEASALGEPRRRSQGTITAESLSSTAAKGVKALQLTAPQRLTGGTSSGGTSSGVSAAKSASVNITAVSGRQRSSSKLLRGRGSSNHGSGDSQRSTARLQLAPTTGQRGNDSAVSASVTSGGPAGNSREPSAAIEAALPGLGAALMPDAAQGDGEGGGATRPAASDAPSSPASSHSDGRLEEVEEVPGKAEGEGEEGHGGRIFLPDGRYISTTTEARATSGSEYGEDFEEDAASEAG